MARSLRFLVVDDSAVYRQIASGILASIPGVEVVGSAPNGRIALSRLDELKPDALILDIEMPVLDGLETLEILRRDHPEVAVVMASAHTVEGAAVTLQALELGAMDFVSKPESACLAANKATLRNKLVSIVEALRGQKRPDTRRLSSSAHRLPPAKASQGGEPALVAIGISTGGPRALSKVIPALPTDLPVPVVIVQHMPPLFTAQLARSLDAKSRVRVIEARPNQRLQAGTVYIAPGGKQTKVGVEAGSGRRVLRITDDPPENNCKPSVDYLFRSVAVVYESRAIGVIMTGMGSDGALGLQLMKRHGVTVIAQDQQSSVVFGMAAEAIKAGVVDVVCSLDEIAGYIATRSRVWA